MPLGQLAFVQQLFWRGDVGHVVLVVQARLLDLEGTGHVQDRTPRLDGDDPTGGEAAAVAVAVDLVEHGLGRVAGPHEIGVQRMGGAVGVDRAHRGHERLRDDLPAETAPLARRRGDAAIEIILDPFDVEDAGQFVIAVRGAIVAGVAHGPLRSGARTCRGPAGWSVMDGPNASGFCRAASC